MRALIVLLIIALSLSACGQKESAHVQCYSDGEMVFDYIFDKVEIDQGGALTVWIGQDSALLVGDCRLVH